jgi:hypothetical protein
MRRSVVALALASLVGPACRSAAPPAAPGAPEAPAPEFIAAYVGQSLILRHYGAQQRIALTRQDLARSAGDCDVGVYVREAGFAGGTATLTLDALGPATLLDKAASHARGTCGSLAAFIVSVSGYGAADAPETMQAELGRLVATPEAYLAAKGVPFDRPAGPEPTLAASQDRNASSDERTLARQVKTWPRPLLRVEPFYRDPGGRVRHEGELEFTSVVGEDGRLHSPRLRTPLAAPHEEHVLRALALWRYEPAMADAPVAARILGRCTFRVY